MKTSAIIGFVAMSLVGCADDESFTGPTEWSPDYSKPIEVDFSDNLGEVHWESIEIAVDMINDEVGSEVFRVVRGKHQENRVHFSIDRDNALPANWVASADLTETSCSVLLATTARVEAATLGLLGCIGYTSMAIHDQLDPMVIQSIRSSVELAR